jgi:predicted acylesterase/phospholipase RssA
MLNPNHELLEGFMAGMGQQVKKQNLKESTFEQDETIDVVISGGGNKGYFVTGAARVLQQYQERMGITIARYAGSSAGAWCAVFMAIGMDTLKWTEVF